MIDIGLLSQEIYSLDKNNENFNIFYIYFELILSILIFIFLILTLPLPFIVYKHSYFHQNFTILIQNLGFCYFIGAISRIIVAYKIFECFDCDNCYISDLFLLKNSIIFEYIKFVANAAYFIASNCIMLERIWAIKNLKRYENKKDYKLIIFIIVLQWLLSAGGYWLTFEGYIPRTIMNGFGIFVAVFLPLCYKYMDSRNLKNYRLSKRIGNSFTLTERYQLEENVKTSILMNSMIKFNFLICTQLFCILLFTHYSKSIISKQIGRLLFDSVLAFCCPFGIIYSFCSVKKWRIIYLRMFLLKKHKITTISPNLNNHLQLNKNPEAEARIYFEQLANAWN